MQYALSLIIIHQAYGGSRKKIPLSSKKMEIIFNGIQRFYGIAPDLWLFTDPKTKTTFSVPAGATEKEILEALAAKREEFRRKGVNHERH